MDLKRYFRGPFLAVLVTLVVVIAVFEYASAGGGYKSVNTSQVVSMINRGEVKTATLVDKNNTIQITTKGGDKLEASWVGNQGWELQQKLQTQVQNGTLSSYNVENPSGTTLLSLIGGFLPWVLIILFFLFILNQMQGGGSRVMNFGKSKAKLITKDTPKTTFADVAGADEPIEELQEIKEFLQNPAKFQAIGAKIPKGVLLYGPPGTGKTLLARAVAGEANVPFYSISGSDFVEMFVGVGASRVRDLFEQAKANAPAIVFVDEIDAVGRHRGAGLGGGHDEREQTLNQMLVELDGFDTKGGVIVIAATNRPDILDPALLRPGRFDRQIMVPQPDLTGRKGILRVHSRGKPFASDVDLDVIARRTPGFTGADLANVINEGALLTARSNSTQITMASLEEAIDRVMAGPERKSVLLSEKERKLIAYHEGGHALVGHALPNADPARAGPRLHCGGAGRGQVPRDPGRVERPVGHAARRAHGRGTRLPRADHRRGQRHREGVPDRPGHGHRVRDERTAGRAQVRDRGRRAVPRPGDGPCPGLLRGDCLRDRRGGAQAHRVRARRVLGDPGSVP
jgi:cell division protease FtsH